MLDADFTTATTPIHRLPYELLCEIFLRRFSRSTSNTNSTAFPFQHLDLTTDSLFVILQVCSSWRQTALSAPQLWNTILINLSHLNGPNIPQTHTHHLIDQNHSYSCNHIPSSSQGCADCTHKRLLFRLNLALSVLEPTSLPLNFAFYGTYMLSSHNLTPVLKALCMHSERWGKVYMNPYTTNVLSCFLSSPPTDENYISGLDATDTSPSSLPSSSRSRSPELHTPHLTTLGLTSFNPFPGIYQVPNRLSGIRSLTKLALYDYRFEYPSTEHSFPLPLPHTPSSSPSETSSPSLLTSTSILVSPYTTITSLLITSTTYTSLPYLLHSLPSLQKLSLINKYQQSPSPPSKPIVLGNLMELKVGGWLGNLCFLLPYLKMPKIKWVKVTALEDPCAPCSCVGVKKRIVGEWVEGLVRPTVMKSPDSGRCGVGVGVVDVDLRHLPSSDSEKLIVDTDDCVVRFLFAEDWGSEAEGSG